MKNRNFYLLLPILGLLVAAPAVLAAQETAPPACLPLLLQEAPTLSPAQMPLFTAGIPPAGSLSIVCGSCSFHCGGAPEGNACLTFTGGPGTCQSDGRICGDHKFHCNCAAN